MGLPLPPRAVELLDTSILVVLTTLNADGSPHSTPVWALRDGSDVLMSTISRRTKARNLQREPRASIVILDPENPICYFSLNGPVTLAPDEDRSVLDALSMKYLGTPYPAENPANVRLVARLSATHVIAQYKPAS